MQLNLHKIEVSKSMSEIVDTINLNFEQLVLNGGGPNGKKGMIGPPGLPGKQGLRGDKGDTGVKGSSVHAYNSTGTGIEDLSEFDVFGKVVSNTTAYTIATDLGAVDGDLVITVVDGELYIYEYLEQVSNSLHEGKFILKESGASSANLYWSIFNPTVTSDKFLRSTAGTTSPVGVMIASALGFTDDPANIGINGYVKIEDNSFFKAYADKDIKSFDGSPARPSGIVGGGILIADEHRAKSFTDGTLDYRVAGMILKTYSDGNISNDINNPIVTKISTYVSNDSTNAIQRRFEINLHDDNNPANFSVINNGSVLINKSSKASSYYDLEIGGSVYLGDGDGFAFTTDYSQYLKGKLQIGTYVAEENTSLSVKSYDKLVSGNKTSLGNTFLNHIYDSANTNKSKTLIIKSLSKDDTTTSANYANGNAIFEEEVLTMSSGNILLNNESPLKYTTFNSPKYLSNNILYPTGGMTSTSKTISKKGTITSVTGVLNAVNHGFNTKKAIAQLTLGSVYGNDDNTTYGKYGSQVVLENRAFFDATGNVNFNSNVDFLLGYNINFSNQVNILNRLTQLTNNTNTYMPANALMFSRGYVHVPIIGQEDSSSGGNDGLFKSKSALTLTPYGTASIGKSLEEKDSTNDYYANPVNNLHIGKYFSFTDGREYGETNNNGTPGNSGLLFNAVRTNTGYSRILSNRLGKGLIFDEINGAVRISKVTGTGNEIPELSIYSGTDFNNKDNSGIPRVLVGNSNTFLGILGNSVVPSQIKRRGTLNVRGRIDSTKDIYNIVLSEESKKRVGVNYDPLKQGADLFGIAAYNGFYSIDPGSGNQKGIADSQTINWFRLDSLYDRSNNCSTVNDLTFEGKSLFSIADYKSGNTKESIANFGYTGSRMFFGLNTNSASLDVDGISDMYTNSSSILDSWNKYGRVYLDNPYVSQPNGSDLANIVSKDGSIRLITDSAKIQEAARLGDGNAFGASDYGNFGYFDQSQYMKCAAKLQFGSYNSNLGQSPYVEGAAEYEIVHIPPISTVTGVSPSALTIQSTNNNIYLEHGVYNDPTRFMTFSAQHSDGVLNNANRPFTISHTRMLFAEGIGSASPNLHSDGSIGDMIPIYQPIRVYSRMHNKASLAVGTAINDGCALDSSFDNSAYNNAHPNQKIGSDNTHEDHLDIGCIGIGYSYIRGNDVPRGNYLINVESTNCCAELAVAIMAYGRIFSNHEIASLSDKTEKNHIKNVNAYEALEAIEKLNPVYFSFKNTPEDLSVGFYAQEVEEIFPGAVKRLDISTEDEEEKVRLPLDYSALYTHAIAATQVLIKENREKTEQIKSLENALIELTERISKLEKGI